MPFSPCDHLTSTPVNCETGPAPGTMCACVCKNTAGTAVRPRLRNVHSAAHGRLTKLDVTPPPGIAAIYALEHDTDETQSPGTVVDGDWIPYSGGSVTIRIRYSGPGGPDTFDVSSNNPDAC